MKGSKPLVWLQGEIKTPPFSHLARIEAGFLLRRLQDGEFIEMPASRPLAAIGPNCHELRIVDGRISKTAPRVRTGEQGEEGMRPEKRRKLEAAGWRVGDARDFLDLTASEAEFVEIKLALARGIRRFRERHHWTQEEFATRVGSSQSRVAKMEAADRTVSVDLLVRSLLAAGADRRQLARILAPPPRETGTPRPAGG